MNRDCGPIWSFIKVLKHNKHKRNLGLNQHWKTDLVDIFDHVEACCAFNIDVCTVPLQKVGRVGYDAPVVNNSVMNSNGLGIRTASGLNIGMASDVCLILEQFWEAFGAHALFIHAQ